MDLLPDWGIDNPLQSALIHAHLENHESDEITEVVIQMEGPHEILRKTSFLKDEGYRCFKNCDFRDAVAYYLSGIKLFCFSCIISDAHEALFRCS